MEETLSYCWFFFASFFLINYEKKKKKCCRLKSYRHAILPEQFGNALMTVNLLKPIYSYAEPFENIVNPDQLASRSTVFSALRVNTG